MSRVARRVGVLCLALVASTLPVAGAPAPVPAAAAPSQAAQSYAAQSGPWVTTVPDPAVSADPTGVTVSSGSAGLWAFRSGGVGGGRLLAPGSAQWAPVPVALEACTRSLRVVGRFLSCVAGAGPTGGATGVVADTTDGSVRRFPLPDGALSADGDSFVQVAGSVVTRYRPDGTSEVVADLTGSPWQPTVAAPSDGTGLVLVHQTPDGTTDNRLVTASGLVDVDRAGSGGVVAGRMLVHRDGQALLLSATDGRVLSSVPFPTGTTGAVLSDAGVAWRTSDQGLYTAPVADDGSLGAVVPADPTTSAYSLLPFGDGFVLGFGNGRRAGLAPGATSATDLVALVLPRLVRSLHLAEGRLTQLDDRVSGQESAVVERPVGGPADAGPVVGPETVATRRAVGLSTSAGRTLIHHGNGSYELGDRGAWASATSTPAGSRLVGSLLISPAEVRTVGGARLAALTDTTGAAAAAVAGDGRHVVWQRPDRSVWATDLLGLGRRAAPVQLAPPAQSCAAGTSPECVTRVAVSEGWALLLRASGRLEAMPVGGGLAVVLATSGARGVWASGGRAVWLRSRDAVDPVSDVVETALGPTPGAPALLGEKSTRGALDVSGGLTAWVAPDNQVRVARSQVAASRWRTLGPPVGDVGLSPNGDGVHDVWRLALDLDRSVPSAAVVIATSSGQVVRSLPAPAGDASVRVAWDGRDAAGAVVPDGAYTWNLSAPGAGPRRVAKDVRPTTWGTLQVRRVGPVVRITRAPAVSSDASTVEAELGVSWAVSTGVAPVTYEVTYDATTLWPDGSVARLFDADASSGVAGTTWTARPPYLDRVPPAALTAQVRARDALGNTGPWASTPRMLLPWDDSGRLHAVSVGTGWTTVADPQAYGGSFRRSSTAGSALRVSASATGVVVIGRRCPTCSRAEVLVDGRVAAVLDTQGAWSQRSHLGTVRFARGHHQVLVRNGATSGRPWLMVDGFAWIPE